MKQKIFLCLILFLSLSAYAQQRTELKGNIINSANGEPLGGVTVSIQGQNQSEITNSIGEFHFMNVSPGKYTLVINSSEIVTREIPVTIEANTTLLLEDIKVMVVSGIENMALLNSVDDTFLDDESSSQEISSMIILSNDVYLKKVGYQLSNLRFKVRGYDNNYQGKYINGVEFNDQYRGVFNYASIGALNDVTRNGDAVNYQTPNTFTFGNIGGTENINMRAGTFSKGGKVTLSYANRNYYTRGMATYSSGLMDDGYAYNVSVGGRYSDEGNVKGTYYRNVSLSIGMEKQWMNGKHSLSFNAFVSPVERGQAGASVQEAYDYVGDNLYNPNWGYQNGKKRNSRVVKAYDPTAILSHVWKINPNATLTTGIASHYGRYGGTALNWYDGIDPRADYYRYLPSNIEIDEEYPQSITDMVWKENDPSYTQLNWDKMYMANYLAKTNGDPASIYMVEERRSDLFETSLNSTLNVSVTNNSRVIAGTGARSSQSRQFKTVDDLLGAEYVLDKDKYAERDFGADSDTKENDLNRPGRKAYKDDIFGYDFRININSANAWVQNEYTMNKLDIYYGAKIKYTEFQRDGKMRNGRYPDNSYGKGEKHSFVDFAVKGGLTYKITGRHLLTGNINYATQAPLPNNAYVSPRISDNTLDMDNEKIFSADINYIFSLPSFSGRVSVFQTNFWNGMKKQGYYHDGERTFVNHIIKGIDKINRGVELGIAYKITNNWSVDLIGTVAEYYYSSNADGVINFENGSQENKEEKVYLKNAYVGGTPQIAGSLGLNYFYNYWFFSLNANGFARNYIDISPLRRVASNYTSVSPDDETAYGAYKYLTHQERYGSGMTFDFSIGKVFYLANKQSLNFNVALNNFLNRKNIKTGGYEQARIDLTNPQKFNSKYYYLQGLSCFINASYRF
ncbi:MAG: TonB-dependent receptor [Prevotella sp.]|jgi:hypothetical protein|nr:TonB-dependent receptor [Prevotella sp.]